MSQIKSRLKAAYENVEFYASNTWVHSSHEYQKANQELYVRENIVKDALADEPIRSRTVQDSIPQSRLAQYSNYEYNESRELCYASSATNISFYYPCVCKRSSIKEPWMIPEIEQLFIWFSYAPNFNILELLRLEELGHLDEQEKLKVARNLPCRWRDFHEISPVIYETLERTPGKSRYTGCPPITEMDLTKFVPTQLKIQTFEDMILRMKIKSDKIKYLWSDHSRPKSESLLKDKMLNILKSPLGNYFLLENLEDTTNQYQKERQHKKVGALDDRQLKTFDFEQLQNLAESIRTLETFIFNSARQSSTTSFSTNNFNNYETPEIVPKTEITPTRRLYSAVLQGLTTDKKQLSSTDVTSPPSCSTKEQSSFTTSSTSPVKTSSCFSTENSSLTVLTPIHKSTPILSKNHTPCVNSPSQWVTQPPCWGASNFPTKNYNQVKQEQTKPTCMQLNFAPLKPQSSQKTETANASNQLTNLPSNTTIATSYSDTYAANTAANVPCSPPNITNMPGYSVSTAYLGNTYANNNVCFHNNYGNNNYFNNSYHFNSQYTTNFQNNSYTGTSFSNNNLYGNTTYQTNQVSPMNSRNVFPQFNRQPYPSNQAHISSPHSMWFVQHNRPSSAVYSVAHFAINQPYLYLQPPPPPPPPLPTSLPPRQNQRWTTPTHYMRTPSSLQSYHMPITPQHTSSSLSPQHWGIQDQNLSRANSSQQISSSSQQFLDSLPGQSVRGKPKTKKNKPGMQMNLLQHKTRSRSPEDNSLSNENLDTIEFSSGTCSNMSMGYSKRSIGSSDLAVSLPLLEKSHLIKAAASTSSLDYRKLKIYNDYKEHEHLNIEKRSSAVIVGRRNENSNFFSSDSEESHTLLPIAVTVSEELERQALEQYQPSDENFYQELERQAEEQYVQDHSENWIGPLNKNLFFGGQTIHTILEITKNYLFLFLVVYIDINVCNYCLFLLS